MSDETPRFEVRDVSGCGWLPDFIVVDTELELRVAAYDSEEDAHEDCDERNAAEKAE